LEFTVFGAVVRCDSGNKTTVFTPPYRGVIIGKGWPGTEYDTTADDFLANFGYCRKIDATCVMSLYDRWFMPSEGVMIRPGFDPRQALAALDFRLKPEEPPVEALLTMKSALVCSKGGQVRFVTDGQLAEHTSGLNLIEYMFIRKKKQMETKQNNIRNMRTLPLANRPPYRERVSQTPKYISPYGEIVVNITSPYGYRTNQRTGVTQLHSGWDFGYKTDLNTPIYSITQGEVVAVRDGSNRGLDYGTHVIVQYNDPVIGDFQALYAHLKFGSADHLVSGWENGEGTLIEEKRKIKKGDEIGKQGDTTRGNAGSGEYHLHFQTWKGTTIDYAPLATFNPLSELYEIEMTSEGINDKSNLFILYDDKTRYSWTVAFLNKYGREHKTFNDPDILDLIEELMKEKNPLEETND